MKSIHLLLCCLLFTSCLGTRYLQEGETILRTQKISGSKSLDKDAIEGLFEQSPNSKLFGKLPVSLEVHAYEIGKRFFNPSKVSEKRQKTAEKYQARIAKAKKERKKNKLTRKLNDKLEKIDKKLEEGNIFMRWGAPLAVFDSTGVFATQENIRKYLFSKGYFNAAVSGNIRTEGHFTRVEYEIDRRLAYKIDSLIFSIKDDKVARLFHEHLDENLLPGSRYDQDLISRERDRVFDLLTNNGYYAFKRQYVLFEVDSALLGDHRLVIRETIANPPGESAHKVYKLDSVIFTTESNVHLSRQNKILNYNTITYDFANDRYSPKILDWRLFLYPDSIYDRSAAQLTQKQLAYLDMFKFVNINYDSTGGKFIANIFTSPLNKYQTSMEVGLSVNDQVAQNLPGPFINFNAKNRNLFRGLEILEFNGNASLQGLSSVTTQKNNYSRIQYGGALSITFPQFLFPLGGTYKSRIGRYNPKTKISIGINFEDRINEYKRNTFNTNMSYIWQVRDNSQFTFKPFDVSYIFSINGQDFHDDLDSLGDLGNISYVSAFQSAFVSSSVFIMGLNLNGYGIDNKNATLIKFYIENGGSLETFFGKQPFKEDRDLEYYKFVKGNIDFRQTFRLSRKSSLAYRINIGAAYIYGDNQALPYEKYYFAGGSNSIRAWQPRRLGPGAYAIYNDSTDTEGASVNYDREQPGDIIIETSLEFRRKLFKFVDYALFADAGNVWLWHSRTTTGQEDQQGDDGVFRFKNFARELAVGAGAGLRIDFSFLILRLDGAVKLIDPARRLGHRYVGDELTFRNLWDKTTLNIGIGYPF